MQSIFSISLTNGCKFDSLSSPNLVAKLSLILCPLCFKLSPFSFNHILIFLTFAFSAKFPIAFPAPSKPDKTLPSNRLVRKLKKC